MWMGVGVVCLWKEQAWVTLNMKKSDREAHDWLILGVCTGFLGSVLDNAFWGLAWTLDYIELEPARSIVFEWGALPNIFFRQLAGIFAAHCHITSFLVRSENGFYLSSYRTMVVLSILFGLIWVVAAAVIRNH